MLLSHHLVLCIGSNVRSGNSWLPAGREYLLMVGCQVGGDYRCNILYLLARLCVHTAEVLRGTTSVEASTVWTQRLASK
jgi:hypothetical protein